MGMFDDLIPAAGGGERPRPSAGGMFDDLVPARAEPSPIASQFGGAPLTEPQLDPIAAPAPTIADRFRINAREAFDSTLAGEAINRVRSGQVAQTAADDMFRAIVEARRAGSAVALDSYEDGKPSAYAAMPLAQLEADFNRTSAGAGQRADTFAAQRAQQQAEMASLPSFTQAETLTDKAVQGAIALAGQLAGGFASPENLIGGPGIAGARRVAARELAEGAVTGAAGAGLANPVVQSGRVERGEQGGFSAAELGESVLLGGGVGAAFKIPGVIGRAVMDRIAARRGVPTDKLDPNSVSQAEAADALSDPQVAALAKANGIDVATDPRVAQLTEILGRRRIEEQLRANPVDPASPIMAAEFRVSPEKGAVSPEIARREAEVSGVETGTIDPAATNVVPRQPDARTIMVDQQGGAFREDPGALAGRQKAEVIGAADQRRLPAPGREVLTDEEIARQRAAAAGGRRPDVEAPPRLMGGEERAPRDAAGVQADRQAGDAFATAQRQKDRVGPEVRDTQPAGRPRGVDDNLAVMVDGEQPVRLKGTNGEKVVVEPYDPRTGRPAGETYEVKPTALREVSYAREPRMAQDFVDRAQGPKPPERPRAPPEPVVRQPEQTYRAGDAPAPLAKPDTSPSAPPPRPADVAPRSAAGDAPTAATVRGDPLPSYDAAVRAEAERLWSTDMPGRKRGKRSNESAVMDSARETVMRREAAEHVDRALREDGLPNDAVLEIARHYRRADGETPQQAFDRAAMRWFDQADRDAMRELNLFDQADRDHDILKAEGKGGPASDLYERLEDHYTGGKVDNDAIPFDQGRGSRGEAAPEGRAAGGEPGGEARGGRADAVSDVTDAGPDGKRQTVIPGAERISDKQLAERRGQEPLKGKSEPPPKGGLFDDDARNQRDMFDAPAKTDPRSDVVRLEREIDEASTKAREAKGAEKDELLEDIARLERELADAEAKAADLPGAQFSSNPMFDPKMWRWYARALGFDEKWRGELAALAKDIASAKDDVRGHKTSWAGDMARLVFYSTDGALRALGKHYGDSPTIKKIADLLFAPADVGRGGAVKQTFTEGVAERANRNLNGLAKIMEPFAGKAAVSDQIVRLVQNPQRIKPGTPIHDAANAIRKMLDDEHEYLNAAGVKTPYVKGYYPREVDVSRAIANPAGFRAAAERAYRAAGLSAQEAKSAADNWLERVALGGVNVRPDGTDFVTLGGSPNRDFAKGRVLTKAADEIMAPFYHRDPLEALTVHFQRTARRAEWARRFGDELEQWKELKQALIDEGNAAAIPEVVRAVSASTGANPAILPRSVSSAIGWLRTYGVIRLLPRATITSLSEVLLPSIRSGSPGRALGDIVRTTRALWEKTGKLGEQREFAEDLGLIMRGSENGILASRFNALDPTNRVQERILNRFFRRTGLEQWTAATRVTAVSAAETFIRRLALDVDGGKGNSALSKSLLAELGIEDAAGFSKWVAANRDVPKGRDIDEGGHADTYRAAVVRFVNQSIMAPSASTRPRWANHPLGSLIFMLQSYGYAFQKNVINRAGNAIAQAATNKDFTLGDRARVLAPVAMLPALMAIQLGIAPMRQAVFGTSGKETKNDDEKTAQQVMQAFSRSGLTGALDPLFNIYSGAKYHRDAATGALGPVVGGLAQSVDTALRLAPQAYGGTNSERTNTAERNAARAVYEMVVAPAVITGASLLPAPIGAPLAQAPGTSTARDAFVDALAGEKQATGGRGRPRREGRH